MKDNYLDEVFATSKYNRKGFAKSLDITEKTLKHWLNAKGIDQAVKFIELLYNLEIDPIEYLNIYYTTSKYKNPLTITIESLIKENENLKKLLEKT